ncbi:hypothetical protein TrRE_jg12443, partial [Triparma retinervis]
MDGSYVKIIFLLLFSLIPLLTDAACPRGCSGHGTCGAGGVCTCFPGFGYSADCSLRTCPTGPAWADKASAADTAHALVECSNAGICDRSIGICECFEGYTGAACRRSSCPNDCSGNGVCMTIKDAGLYLGRDYDSKPGATGGDGMGPKYTNWDAESIGVCNCDFGFFGPDCSRRMCPKADDPITINQNYRSVMVRLNTGNGAGFGGTLKVNYLGHIAEFSMTTQWTPAYCKQQWEKLDNIETVSCLVDEGNSINSAYEGKNATMNVTFTAFPTLPSENNFFSHTGNPPISSFTCDTSGIAVTAGSSKSCVIKDLISTDVREYEFCGRRGTCDFSSGLCYCFIGYTGMDCTSESLSMSASNAEPALGVTAVGNDFIGNVLEVQSQKAAAADFKFMSCKADGTEVFSITGQGRINLGELVITQTGATIQDGGLMIDSGGQTISQHGMFVTNHLGGQNSLQVTSSNTAMTSATIAAYSATTAPASKPNFNLIEAGESSAALMFKVRGDGKTTILGGGLSVDAGGATIASGGLGITNGGATIQSTIESLDHSLYVMSGASIYNNRKNHTVLKVNAGLDTHNGTALEVSSDAAAGNKFYSLLKTVINADADNGNPAQTIFRVSALPKTEILAGGLDVWAGGVKVRAGGLRVLAGGATIGGGGISISGATTFADAVEFDGAVSIAGATVD